MILPNNVSNNLTYLDLFTLVNHTWFVFFSFFIRYCFYFCSIISGKYITCLLSLWCEYVVSFWDQIRNVITVSKHLVTCKESSSLLHFPCLKNILAVFFALKSSEWASIWIYFSMHNDLRAVERPWPWGGWVGQQLILTFLVGIRMYT